MIPSYMLPTWNELGVGMANHIWQSTVFMVFVGALTLLFRRNRAVVRYRLWLIASVKFLVPFSLLVGIGSLLDWTPVQQFTPTEVPVVIRQMSQPFAVSPAIVSKPAAPAALPAANHSPAPLVAVVWFVGAVWVFMVWFIRWSQVARVARNARPFEASLPWIQSQGKFPRVRILASPSGLEPGVFRIFRPILLVPEDLAQHLNAAQLRPIIAHEISHVRGRDNLAAAMHTLVQSAFWFHPLVWWLGKRLVDERERACDEAVLQLGCEPADYAEGILKVCKRYVIAPACVAGVSGSNLKKRIEAIMENRETHNLTLGKKLVLAFAGAGILVGPLLGGVAGMPKSAEVPIVSILASPVPVYEAALKVAAPAVAAQQSRTPPQAPAAPAVQAETERQRPFDDISIVTTDEERKAIENLEYRIAQASPAVPPQAPAQPAVQPSNEQQRWLDDVTVIITDEERSAFIRMRDDEQRQNFIMNFWLVRDPTPGTPANEFRDEYNRRVAYANQHFTTQSGIPGSRTDRGKMYILRGSPDEIVSHPIGGTFRGTGQGNNFTSTITTFPFETWTYRHIGGKDESATYEFVDRQMNGDYTLEYDSGAKTGNEGAALPSTIGNRTFKFSIGRTF